MVPLALGLTAGMFLMWLLYTGKRRHIKLVEEEKLLLLQEQQIVVEFMHNMVEAVVQGGSRREMFQRIIHAAILSTNAMSAALFEKQPDNTLKGIAIEGLFPPQHKLSPALTNKAATRTTHLESILRSEVFRMGEGLIGGVAQSRRGLLIANAQNDPRVTQHGDDALQIRSIIVTPVLFQGELIAVLAVANPCDGLAFTEMDFSLVESLAEQVGLAVHNSDAMKLQIEKNKLDLDLELASNIQSLLLPSKFPQAEHLEFAAHYTAAQKIGGDLYDVFPIDNHRIGIAIADVSGKGISASLLMAICQTHLRHLSRRQESPAEILKSINREMEHSMRRDMFITMIYAVIDTEKHNITLARAGHELPLYYHSENGNVSIEAIQSAGMAIGMVPPEIFNHSIKDTVIPFNYGDALVLYTDGVTESVNSKGEEFSSLRLTDALKSNGKGGAQSILNHVITNVHRFSGDEGQADDLTLIVVKHN